MLQKRASKERGHFTADWLNSYHTFSFSEYYDPNHMHFRDLRVINEDRVKPGGGFPLHPHRDMEIISLVLSGALKHEDSFGHSELIEAGGVQLISAGEGIRHSEYNPSQEEEVHFLQIWVFPEEKGLEPGYQFASFDLWNGERLTPIANREGRNGALTIHQDAAIDFLTLPSSGRFEKPLVAGRHAWVQVVKGEVDVNSVTLQAGDGLAVSEESGIVLSSTAGSELLVFDLA